MARTPGQDVRCIATTAALYWEDARRRHREAPVSDPSRPDATCEANGCDEPAVVSPRAPTAAEVVPKPLGEIVPLCARHAEQANTPEDPPV